MSVRYNPITSTAGTLHVLGDEEPSYSILILSIFGIVFPVRVVGIISS